jgi:hypothetical protein
MYIDGELCDEYLGRAIMSVKLCYNVVRRKCS